MKINTFTTISRSAILATSLIVGISSNAPAQDNVSVDLSVLSDGGYGGTQAGTTMSGSLMMPSSVMPKSSYFGPTVTITNPIPAPVSTPTPEPTLATADTVPPPEPEPAPSVPEVAPEPVVADTAQSAEPEVMAESSDAATEETSDTETASATSGPTALEPGRAMLVAFDGTETKLSANDKGDLDTIAATVGANEDLRIQLMAYAGGNDLSSSKARRLSLSRALAVRSYFIEQGVRSTRIDVRALGDKTDEEPINRVDVNITER